MKLSAQKGGMVKSLLFSLLFISNLFLWADDPETPKSEFTNSLPASVGAAICRALQEKSVLVQIGSRIETTAGATLLPFYKDAQCRPVWSDANGINAQALFLIYAIKQSAGDGLDIDNPSYHLRSIITVMDLIKSDFSSKNNPVVLAHLDILLTDAYLILGKHLYYGLLPREEAKEKWRIAKKEPVDLSLRLKKSLQERNVQESLEQLSPSSLGYQGLRNVMMKYLRIRETGGWKKIESTYSNSEGVEQYSIEDLKERLRVEGDFSSDENSSEAYQNAVKTFQRRHAIKADGLVRKEMLSKLNISVEEKIAALRLNLERWRWMPTEEERFYVLVNIPDFSLSVVNEDTTVLKMRAIVGKVERATPILNARMNTIVVNPYWRVPATILREDIFPKVRKNIRYLKKERIRVYKHGDETGKKAINPARINWKKANADTFPYFLRQSPGRKNVLGHLKFIFPNPDDIYIHDTPIKSLFEKEVRPFSSGCIRIQEPLKLAHYLLKNDGNMWGYRNIVKLMAKGHNKTIPLSTSVKVHINYWTVWVDDDGIANFRDDVYGYDLDLAKIIGWRNTTETR